MKIGDRIRKWLDRRNYPPPLGEDVTPSPIITKQTAKVLAGILAGIAGALYLILGR